MSYTPSSAFAPATAIADNPIYAVHNLRPSSLKYTAAALAACRLNLRDFRFVIAGDSIPAGLQLGTSAQQTAGNFGRRAAQYLSLKTGLNYRRSLVTIGSGTTNTLDSQWTLGTGWSLFAGAIGSNNRAYTSAAGNAGTVDFVPTDETGTAIQTDSFIIHAYAGGTAGNFQWSIDGGTFTTQTVTGGTGWFPFTVSAGALGLHTLHVMSTATGNAAYIWGAEAVNSTSRGIRFMTTGTPSSVTPSSITGDDLTGWKGVAPDLVMFQWNTNEYGTQGAISTFQSNMAAIGNFGASLTKPADTLWLSSPPQGTLNAIPQQSYYDAMDATSDSVGFPVLHVDRSLVSYAVSNPAPLSLYADLVHPSAAGHNRWGSQIASILALY